MIRSACHGFVEMNQVGKNYYMNVRLFFSILKLMKYNNFFFSATERKQVVVCNRSKVGLLGVQYSLCEYTCPHWNCI